MKFIAGLILLIQSILDRLPSRKESILNRIQEIKDEIKKLQSKGGSWTVIDSARYYKLDDELCELEKRSEKIGK